MNTKGKKQALSKVEWRAHDPNYGHDNPRCPQCHRDEPPGSCGGQREKTTRKRRRMLV